MALKGFTILSLHLFSCWNPNKAFYNLVKVYIYLYVTWNQTQHLCLGFLLMVSYHRCQASTTHSLESWSSACCARNQKTDLMSNTSWDSRTSKIRSPCFWRPQKSMCIHTVPACVCVPTIPIKQCTWGECKINLLTQFLLMIQQENRQITEECGNQQNE